ncbi:MAG: sensor histidine kinase [Candidatus Spyradocola sp.]
MKLSIRQRWARLHGRARARLCALWGAEAAAAMLLAAVGFRMPPLTGIVRGYAVLGASLLLAALTGLGALAFLYEERKAVEAIDRESRDAMRVFQLKERTQRHDLHIHLMALIGMLDAERYAECRDYLRKMLDTSMQLSQLMPVDDPAISAMLSQAAETAGRSGVSLQVSVYDDLSGIACEAYEVNQILGNLIKNAVEAVQELPAPLRQVHVILLQRRNQCILRVENEVSPDMDVSDRMFEYGYSGKAEHSGIGLAAVKRIVELYHGNLFQEKDGSRLSMIVQLPKKKA